MRITNELRDYIWDYATSKETWFDIADRIDAEHEKAIWELNNLAGVSVLLPVDADGEYIHMGDRMENGELVVRIVLTDGSWEPTVYTASTPNQLHEHYCHDIRHYHESTVEDVLGEFFEEVGDGLHTLKAVDTQAIIAKYAAKLRLANVGE